MRSKLIAGAALAFAFAAGATAGAVSVKRNFIYTFEVTNGPRRDLIDTMLGYACPELETEIGLPPTDCKRKLFRRAVIRYDPQERNDADKRFLTLSVKMRVRGDFAETEDSTGE